jgi:hypothetical protein
MGAWDNRACQFLRFTWCELPWRPYYAGRQRPFWIVAVEIHGGFERSIQLLLPLLPRRNLDVRGRRVRSGRVGPTDGLDEDVASRHTAFLDEVINRELGLPPGSKLSYDRAFQGSFSGQGLGNQQTAYAHGSSAGVALRQAASL